MPLRISIQEVIPLTLERMRHVEYCARCIAGIAVCSIGLRQDGGAAVRFDPRIVCILQDLPGEALFRSFDDN